MVQLTVKSESEAVDRVTVSTAVVVPESPSVTDVPVMLATGGPMTGGVRLPSALFQPASRICRFVICVASPLAVRDAGETLAPQIVAGCCYETARALAAFYRDCHVLNAESDALRAARLALIAETGQCLRNGLGLLGIAAPERL